MMSKVGSLVITGSVLAALWACGGSDKGPESGAEGGYCSDLAGTCNKGLVCIANTCQYPAHVHPRYEEMAMVPGGAFTMGCNVVSDPNCDSDEYPPHQVNVPAFQIDKYEVTVDQYAWCVVAEQCTKPYYMGSMSDLKGDCNWVEGEMEPHPINCVSWDDMDRYCRWKCPTCRLCSEAEWEKAARGTDERIYPWGNESASCNYVVMYEKGEGCGSLSTMAVGSRPAGASPFGLMDMAGNVSEWVEDCYHSTYNDAPSDGSAVDYSGCQRVRRGGCYASTAEQLRTSGRFEGYPFDNSPVAGGRCCKSSFPIEGTWTDPSSGLTWQDPPVESTTWAEAKQYCDELSVGGGGWHLPTIDELRTLIRGCPGSETGGGCGVTDSCSFSSCWDMTACWNCTEGDGPADGCYWPTGLQGECSLYWSSSVADTEEMAWRVGFYEASVVDGLAITENVVRCVR